MGAETNNTVTDVTKEKRIYCTTCGDLQENSSEFYTNGVTDNVCSSLEDGQGFNSDNDDDNCSALHKADDCLISKLVKKIPSYRSCDWKEFMKDFGANQYNINEALICALCGLEARMFTSNLEIDTTYSIHQATPELSVSIDRKGNFVYKYSDWNGSTKVASGIITGYIDYCMKRNKNDEAVYQISSVTISKYKYTTTGESYGGTYPTISIKIPTADGTEVYKRTTNESFEEDVNKTVAVDIKGKVAAGAETDWLQFFYLYDDWVNDDEITLMAKFKNNNKMAMPICSDMPDVD